MDGRGPRQGGDRPEIGSRLGAGATPGCKNATPGFRPKYSVLALGIVKLFDVSIPRLRLGVETA
jgi:hypothetical protein